VRVRDVAQVVLDYEDWELQSRIDGRLSIVLRARKQDSSDDLHTAAAARDYVRSVALPPGVELHIVGDLSRLTDNMLDVLSGNAMLGLASVFLLLCYFLQLRFAIWVAVGIPFAICLTFLVVNLFGISINAMTLSAVILMMGILVDDAVVVSENTERLRREGLPLPQASILGASQVAQPVGFSALTTVLAFAPLLGLTGMAGGWMTPFVVTVIVVLAASLLESQCLLPAHLAHVPRRGEVPRRALFEHLRDAYKKYIERLLLRRYYTLVVFVLVFIVIMIIGALSIRFTLYPDIDIDTVHVKVELPAGSSFAGTVAAVEQLERELRDFVDPRDLLAVTAEVGHHDTDFYGATEGRNHGWALIALQIQPLGYRSAGTRTRDVTLAVQEWADAKTGFGSLVVQAQTDIPVTGKPLQLEIISNGEERYAMAAEVLVFLGEQPGVTSSWTSHNPGKDVIDLEFNYALLAARALSVEQVIRAVRVAVDGLLVDELQTLDERVRYRLQLPPARSGKLATLENLVVINSRGQPIYLSSVADFKLRSGQADIKHYFGKRVVTVYAEIDEKKTDVGTINAQVSEYVSGLDWPRRYPQARVTFSGQFEDNAEMVSGMSRALAICLIAIFATLIVLFNSLSQPLIVLLCLPFGLIGVVLCYTVQDMALGTMGMTGVIGLMGVLVNDSLVLMHTLNLKRGEKGEFLSVSEVASIAHQRFRPIFITGLTTAVAMMPTAYGFLGENSYIKPIFMSMAWGVLFGGLVSLLLLPILYMLDQDIRSRLGRIRGT
jgi:multidrug efflux pump subunit AcrB